MEDQQQIAISYLFNQMGMLQTSGSSELQI
jgi:hypothetical protein